MRLKQNLLTCVYSMVLIMKYRNIKTTLDGIKFDSRKEAKRYNELKLMERCGLIKNLELQKPFELQPTFRKHNKTYRAIKYIADFVYYDVEKEQIVVEDVKSPATAKDKVYIIKKKMFIYKYEDYEFREII